MTNDDEQLIAEALRAKAGKNAPTAQNTGPATVSVHQTTTPKPVTPPDPLHQAAAMAAAMAPTATPPSAATPTPTPAATPAQPPAPATVPATPPVRHAPTLQAMHQPVPGGFGAPGGHVPAQATAPAAELADEPDGPFAAWWILLIAVILGLALGGMVGILTIL